MEAWLHCAWGGKDRKKSRECAFAGNFLITCCFLSFSLCYCLLKFYLIALLYLSLTNSLLDVCYAACLIQSYKLVDLHPRLLDSTSKKTLTVCALFFSSFFHYRKKRFPSSFLFSFGPFHKALNGYFWFEYVCTPAIGIWSLCRSRGIGTFVAGSKGHVASPSTQFASACTPSWHRIVEA